MFLQAPGILLEFKHEVVITVMVTVFLGAATWPFRKAKESWTALTKQLEDVHTELSTQRSNCLTTLQKQGDEQIKLLGKMADTLSDIHLDQKETLGHLR